MTDLTIRGNRHERRRAARLARKVQNGTSQRNITQDYQAWRKSGDPRADSITFREFSVQRPDQNADYVPARWAQWAKRLNDQQPGIETVVADVSAADVPDDEPPSPDTIPDTVTLEQVVEMLQPSTALDLIVQAAAEEAGSISVVIDAPVKKQRKSRAKKTTAEIVLDAEAV